MEHETAAVFPATLHVQGHDAVRDHLTHSTAATFLFVGPPNVGRRTTALWWFAYLNCESDTRPCGRCASCQRWQTGYHPDVLIKEPVATTRSGAQAANPVLRLDQIALRRGPGADPNPLIPWLRSAPSGTVKMAIVMASDKMTESAANAFLKTLEEPPANTKIVLIAPSRSSVLPTVASRAETVRFGSVPVTPGANEPAWRSDIRYGRVGAVMRSRSADVSDGEWREPIEALVTAMDHDTAALLDACERFVEAERKHPEVDFEGNLVELVRAERPEWLGALVHIMVERREAKAAYVSQRTLSTHLALALAAVVS